LENLSALSSEGALISGIVNHFAGLWKYLRAVLWSAARGTWIPDFNTIKIRREKAIAQYA